METRIYISNKIQKKLLLSTFQDQWQPSVSIGIATYESMPGSIKEMVHKADTLMYAAKQSGKNTIRHQVLRDGKAA